MFTLEPLLLTSVRVAMATRVRPVRACTCVCVCVCVCVCIHGLYLWPCIRVGKHRRGRWGEAGRSAHIEMKNTNTPLILSLKTHRSAAAQKLAEETTPERDQNSESG